MAEIQIKKGLQEGVNNLVRTSGEMAAVLGGVGGGTL